MFLEHGWFFLDGFSRESDRGPGSLSGKREYSVLLWLGSLQELEMGAGN